MWVANAVLLTLVVLVVVVGLLWMADIRSARRQERVAARMSARYGGPASLMLPRRHLPQKYVSGYGPARNTVPADVTAVCAPATRVSPSRGWDRTHE
jgi:hypothetical protein